MTSSPGIGSWPAAVFRVIGFFGLIVLLMPWQLYCVRWRPGEPYRVAQIFHRALTQLLGFSIRQHGIRSAASPTLFVANHTSYLDIPVLAALISASFVAKSEVAGWPLIGLLAKMHQTVFVERRSSQVTGQKDQLRAHLAKGQSLILFPEGTSSDGLQVLPFKTSLFSIVEERINGEAITVQPVSVICTELCGLPLTRALRPLYAWFGDMTLFSHLWNVFKCGRFTVDVTFHPPVTVADFPDRKALALYCQGEVTRGIEAGLCGRPRAGNTDLLPLPTVDQPPSLLLIDKA